MRTTIRLDDRLLADAKQWAAQTGRTFTAIVEDALRETLARRKKTGKPKWTPLPRDGAGGLRPGVSLDHTADLLELMDERDAPA
jgi:hypothetical protein